MVSCLAKVEAPAVIRRAIEGGAAVHVFAVVQGMSTLAKDGAGRERLLRVAASAVAG